MAEKLMYIPNDDPQNKLHLLQIMISGWNVWTLNLMINQSKFTQVPKVYMPKNKKSYYKTLGTSAHRYCFLGTILSNNITIQCYTVI